MATGINIGEMIAKRLHEKGMYKSEFARRIHKSRQNVNDILKRKSLDSALLAKISSVLETNFFVYYNTDILQALEEPRKPYGNSTGNSHIPKSAASNHDGESTGKIVLAEIKSLKNEICLLKQTGRQCEIRLAVLEKHCKKLLQ